jgi:hypothetical protein
MTKAETVDQLIDMGFSYDEVLEQSKGKPSFVKGRFTKKGLSWKSVEVPVEVPVEAEPEVVVEEKRDEGSDQSGDPAIGTEEQIVHSGCLELPQQELYDRALAYQEELKALPTIRRARTGKYIDMVLSVLKDQDYCSRRQSAVNCRYMMISPRPTRMNFYREIFNIQNEMKQVFRKSRK